MFEYRRDKSNVFALEGQVLFITEDKPKGKQLVRLHLTDAHHDDDFNALAQVCDMCMRLPSSVLNRVCYKQ